MSVDDYINQLSAQEKQVLDIARDHLKDSFDIERSIGFTEWKKNKNLHLLLHMNSLKSQK